MVLENSGQNLNVEVRHTLCLDSYHGLSKAVKSITLVFSRKVCLALAYGQKKYVSGKFVFVCLVLVSCHVFKIALSI